MALFSCLSSVQVQNAASPDDECLSLWYWEPEFYDMVPGFSPQQYFGCDVESIDYNQYYFTELQDYQPKKPVPNYWWQQATEEADKTGSVCFIYREKNLVAVSKNESYDLDQSMFVVDKVAPQCYVYNKDIFFVVLGAHTVTVM